MIKGIIYYDYTTNKMTKEDHLAKIFGNIQWNPPIPEELNSQVGIAIVSHPSRFH